MYVSFLKRCEEVTQKNQKKRTEISMTFLKPWHSSWMLSEMKGATHSPKASHMHKTAMCVSFLNR